MTNEMPDWPPTKRDNGKNWGPAKLKILEILWPGEWVEGIKIFHGLPQTYYDRRVRELRESGWQIETHKSGRMYRLNSHIKLPGKNRSYPNKKLKQKVMQRDKGLCQICRQPNDKLQYDHKVPLDRGGGTSLDNLQLLCSPCNVDKRGACKRCTLEDCDGCPYAYPELYGARLVITLEETTAELLRKDSESQGIPDKIIATLIIDQHYKK